MVPGKWALASMVFLLAVGVATCIALYEPPTETKTAPGTVDTLYAPADTLFVEDTMIGKRIEALRAEIESLEKRLLPCSNFTINKASWTCRESL